MWWNGKATIWVLGIIFRIIFFSSSKKSIFNDFGAKIVSFFCLFFETTKKAINIDNYIIWNIIISFELILMVLNSGPFLNIFIRKAKMWDFARAVWFLIDWNHIELNLHFSLSISSDRGFFFTVTYTDNLVDNFDSSVNDIVTYLALAKRFKQ